MYTIVPPRLLIAPKTFSLDERSHAAQELPKDLCQYCLQESGVVVDSEPDERMPNASIFHFTCDNKDCGKVYDKQVPH